MSSYCRSIGRMKSDVRDLLMKRLRGTFMRGPREGNLAKSAGDDLNVDTTSDQEGDQGLDLLIANQRIAADQREVERLEPIHDTQHPAYECVSSVIAEFA
jgi:hypothetical protein